MKDSYFAKLGCFILAFLSFSISSTYAQLEQGKVYRFVNVAYPTYSLCASSLTTVGAGTTLENSKTQLWYVDTRTDGGNTTYRLRSLRTGKYMKGGGNVRWTLTEDGTASNTFLYLQAVQSGGTTNYTLSTNTSTGGVNKMHCDASYNIVGWYSDAAATQWTITEVSEVDGETIDAAWLASNWDEVSNFPPSEDKKTEYQNALNALFSDKACTTLNGTYSAMTEANLEADANYQALPQALRAMVKKIWKVNHGTSVNEAWKEAHYSGNEDLAWDGEYAQRFRVQLYEPYTERECTNAALRINIHTNLNNPTGIFANDGDLLYVMVNDEIKSGASLYLGSYEGHGQAGNYNDGVELHQGLNIIPYWKEKMWTCIYYTVPTLKSWDGTTNKTQYDLSQFPDLKIHIEGGCINGYFNAVGDDLWAHDAVTKGCDDGNNLSTIATTLTKADGSHTASNLNLLQTNNVYPKGDNEADWDYYAARNVMPDLTILGKYMVFQFYYESPESEHPEYSTGYWFNKNDGGTRRLRISDWLERWDRIMMSERLMMGLLSKEEISEANARFHAWDADKHDIFAYTGTDEDFGCDYSKHYRMHGLAISNNSGYMSGGWTSSNYHYSTLNSIIGEITSPTNSGGPTWGPGHEIGHQHQGPFNMRGLTEVTNNLYSNVAVWYDGRGTSRVNGGEGDLTAVLNAYNQTPHDFFSNNIWAQTHMYYKLWLYYHLVGKNTKFYPTLMEMLRRDPMTIGYNQAGATSLLHFYKKVCDAAQEDLTEFFRAYGFFEVMDHRFVGDYSSAEYTQTQEDIDAAINYVKAKNYPVNTNVLFINDYTAGATYKSHDGTTDRKLWDGRTYSDLGSFTVFDGTETSDINGNYTMSVSNGLATISGGTGGLGFLIYDEDGKLLSFSSDYSFSVNDETELAIAKGTAKITSVPLDGEPQEVTYDMTSASVSLLKGMLETAAAELNKNKDDGGTSGDAYTHVGYYKSNRETYVTLVTKYEAAKAVYAEGDVNKYVETYTALRTAYEALLADRYATVSLVDGNKYYIRSVGKGGQYMYLSAKTADGTTIYNVMTSASLPEDKAAYMWSLEKAGEDGKYYFKNHSGDELYVMDVANSNGVQFTCGGGKYAFTVTAIGVGQFNMYSDNAKKYMNADGASSNVISWNNGDNGNSLWLFEVAEEDALAAGTSRLRDMAEQTKELMDRMASVKVKGKQDMSLLRISSNATEQGHGTELLVDNDPGTYFHTNWTGGGAVAEPHYIQIDCADMNDAIDLFTLNWQTLPNSAWNVDAPKTVVVQVTNEMVNGEPVNFQDLITLSAEDANPLPVAKGQSYTSGAIGAAGTPYRFIRLQVTRATGGNWGSYPYFGLAELGITLLNSKVHSIDSAYAAALTESLVHDIADAIGEALNNSFTSAEDVNARYAQMQTHYQTLLAAYNAVANADIVAARQELQELVEKTQALINTCGTVEMITPTIQLQSTDATASGYLYCNAPYTAQANSDYSEQGTDGYHLLDGDINTYLHTDYSGAIPGTHYLRVYMGKEGIGQFAFTYTNRNQGSTYQGNPNIIVVEGSDEEDGAYTEIATVTKDYPLNPMPINSASSYGGTYKSLLLGDKNTRYSYIRFRVTKTEGNRNWFYMSEFGMEGAPYYDATVTTDNPEVTEALLLATEKARTSAVTAISMATDVARLIEAKAELQAAYDVLFEAKTSKVYLNNVISSLKELYASCFTEEDATVIKPAYANSVNLTVRLLDEVKAVIDAAQAVYDDEAATGEVFAEQIDILNAKKQHLQLAIDYAAVPVMLTTDTSHPVYYSIIINRSGYPVFQSRASSEGSENKIRLTAYEKGNDRQMWYFVKGTEAPKVRIVNKATPELIVGCIPTDFAEGAGKIISLAPDAACGTNEWNIVPSTGDWYNITADNNGTTFYMSNHGGVANNMGFYNSSTDGGSQFKFSAEVSDAYKQLYDYFTTGTKEDLSATDNVFPADKIDETAIGYYPSALANGYEAAYGSAAALLLELNATDETYTHAYETLKTANEALSANTPDPTAFYTLRNASSDGRCKNALAYAETDAACRMLYATDLTSADARTLWQFSDNGDGTYLMRNLHTDMYAASGRPFHTQATGESVVFKPVGEGQVVVQANGNSMYALAGWGTIRTENGSDAPNSSSAWFIEKVDDPEVAFQSVTVTNYRHAGFYSAYSVTIPDGLHAYYIGEGDAVGQEGTTVGRAMLTEVTGVIPAHTGVILYGNAGTYEMHYAAKAASAVSNNMLQGSPVACYKQGEADTDYYLFGAKNGAVGLYQAWLQYNSDGTVTDGNANTDNGGYFKASANKIYMPFSVGGQALAAFFFRFNETGIDGVDARIPADAVIYDIQGRRVGQVRQPGMYIVNGQKRMLGKPVAK